jgi:2-polyprenyl-3-methyl-5-hydroxy-6-metoxy-1,4-benzoquinol methylase
MDESKILSSEKEKTEYLTHNNSLENKGYVDMFREFIKRTITPYLDIKNKKKALDFGSGPGPDCVLAHLLKEEGFEVDIYDAYFAPAKVYIDKTYDLITCTEVLEHLKEPLETLKLLKKHLKLNSILALMTLFHPIKGENLDGEEQFQQWWYRRDVTHASFFRPKTFQTIANLLGMSLLKIDQRNTISLQK